MSDTSLEQRVAALEHQLATLEHKLAMLRIAHTIVATTLLSRLRLTIGDDKARIWHAEVSRGIAGLGLDPVVEADAMAVLSTLVNPDFGKP